MKHSVFEQKLIKKIETAIVGITPGLALQVHQNGRKICDIAVGDSYIYYDLASLTKIIFTTQAMMWAFQSGKWKLDTKVSEILSWYPHDTPVLELMNHSSGLIWWAPFYKEISVHDDINKKWEFVARTIRSLPLEKGEVSVYSDVGFLVLAHILEELFQKPLLEVWLEVKEYFYPESTFDMHVDNKPLHDVKRYAPTEKCSWRGRILQGEVHDENTWALNGVTAHAGLFGSIDDLGWFGLFVRGQLLGISRTQIKQRTAQLFANRTRVVGKGDWALGYMMPTPGGSSSGHYFSANAIGHTGFTGTSFWFDPTQDLAVSLLSNRLVFGRDNDGFKKLRPQIHDWIVEILRRN